MNETYQEATDHHKAQGVFYSTFLVVEKFEEIRWAWCVQNLCVQLIRGYDISHRNYPLPHVKPLGKERRFWKRRRRVSWFHDHINNISFLPRADKNFHSVKYKRCYVSSNGIAHLKGR